MYGVTNIIDAEAFIVFKRCSGKYHKGQNGYLNNHFIPFNLTLDL